MDIKVRKRIPAVNTLAEIIPSGAEGGMEFARIVNLLLVYEAKRRGATITVFDDSAGDYGALDAFEDTPNGRIGYQFKFYPSPLRASHRSNIEKSLEKATEFNRKTDSTEVNLRKWILITPDDFVNPARRRTGGDEEWFYGLVGTYKKEFEIEHYGHTKLQALFLETPLMCLQYYPELIVNGEENRKTLLERRISYDRLLYKRFGKIQFVGMSVYKNEAAHGVPIENIYIPLSVVPEAGKDTDSRISPPTLVQRFGSKTVILGDPGSGKSTLLKFLALAGSSKPLQERYGLIADERLPVLVILRDYAARLKNNLDLSILDFLVANFQAESSTDNADRTFFRYYLESGQAILLFDGLDELTDSTLKARVSERIRIFNAAYPGNSILVSSRIVGYDHPFRFDAKEYSHYKITALQLSEINTFVENWYAVRVDDEQVRCSSVRALMNIIKGDENSAIRDFSQNPLLLTIIVLVHRIDAALPDQRVVLYEKCAETLLNTWQKWKDTGIDSKKSSSGDDRQNRMRMEEIAYWMQSRGSDLPQKVIVSHNDLLKFLVTYIGDKEINFIADEKTEEIAEEFLNFVKERTGLLVEAGDKFYSFVHITFQEYFAAKKLNAIIEPHGIAGYYEMLDSYCKNPEWQEVLRLSIADLRSDVTKEMIIEHLLNNSSDYASALLGNLLLDKISTAEKHVNIILERLINTCCTTNDIIALRSFISLLNKFIRKNSINEATASLVLQRMLDRSGLDSEKLYISLVASAIELPKEAKYKLTCDISRVDNEYFKPFSIIFENNIGDQSFELFKNQIIRIVADQKLSLTETPMFYGEAGYFIPSVLQSLILYSRIEGGPSLAFETLLVASIDGARLIEYVLHTILIIGEKGRFNVKSDRVMEQMQTFVKQRAQSQILSIKRVGLSQFDQDRAKIFAWERERAWSWAWAHNTNFWQDILETPELYESVIDFICNVFALAPRHQWHEALRARFMPLVPERIKPLYDKTKWAQIEQAFKDCKDGECTEDDKYYAAFILLFDTGLCYINDYKSQDESPYKNLAELTKN